MNSNKMMNDNYRRINQISARCMRVIVLMLLIMFGYCYFTTDIDLALLIIFFASSVIIALIPTLVVNVFKFDSSPATKHVVILCICIIATLMLTLFSSYAYPVMLFPILLASLYYNQTLVLFTSLLMTCGIFISDIFSLKFSEFFIGCKYDNIVDVLIGCTVPHILIVFGMSVIAYFIVERNAMMIKTAVDTAVTMQENQKGLIYSFAEISESKSKYTGEHIKRVAEYMRVLGKASGFEDDYVEKLATASMMHDIGKLMISEEILDKPDKLTDEEYEIMKNHVLYGEALLKNCPGEMLHLACILAKEHHERWDGTGYLGMKGEEIAYISRLMAVCDVFDALTSDRYYKKGWSLEDTFDEIVRLSGKHFDPKVIKLFIQHYDEFKAIHNKIPDKQKY
ncbi:MAG: HD domain-containing protein [Clostridium sp.]|nr:HD domain-containing protein [Clostridium sp.]MCM1398755.1 HD domain-containing protein [Clostridium sp.]MCM1458613.1 HD domain-containing protein [Bacteroides sp.]